MLTIGYNVHNALFCSDTLADYIECILITYTTPAEIQKHLMNVLELFDGYNQAKLEPNIDMYTTPIEVYVHAFGKATGEPDCLQSYKNKYSISDMKFKIDQEEILERILGWDVARFTDEGDLVVSHDRHPSHEELSLMYYNVDVEVDMDDIPIEYHDRYDPIMKTMLYPQNWFKMYDHIMTVHVHGGDELKMAYMFDTNIALDDYRKLLSCI